MLKKLFPNGPCQRWSHYMHHRILVTTGAVTGHTNVTDTLTRL